MVAGLSSTTPDYWECWCFDDYIHPKTDKKCYRCKASRYKDGMNDALVSEAVKYGLIENSELEYVPA